ncbi:MAG: XdhC family protein, partial [Pseudomonadota bacterium]
PVAVALSTLGRGLDLELANALTDGACPTYVVVATQGQNDRATLAAALQSDARYVAFVGSRRKFAALRATLAAAGADAARLDAVHAPAGLDIGAATAEEIALSILAEITLIRRKGRA